MNKLFFFVLLIDIIFPDIPKALEGQRNKTKIESHHKFIRIEKACITYVYDSKGNKVVFVNIDAKNRIASKTNYLIKNNQNIFLIEENCLQSRKNADTGDLKSILQKE